MKTKDFIGNSSILLSTSLFLLGCSTPSSAYSLSDIGSKDALSIELSESDFPEMPFVSRYYGDNDWQGTLAMNMAYKAIVELRKQIAEHQGYESLKFLTAWESEGEAHITTITPVEYQECMWSNKRGIEVLRMDSIEKIASEGRIQKSDVKILGVGSGAKEFVGRDQTDETFFVIVKSRNLLKIRALIYKAYLNNGGNPNCWHPEKFYPHITIGYTYKDIHFPDVEKNVKGSLDDRFVLGGEAQLQCRSVAVDVAIEAVNLVNKNNFFRSGYIDYASSSKAVEKYRLVLNDDSGHPDGEHAFEVALNANDNCNFISLVDDYDGEELPNPYE